MKKRYDFGEGNWREELMQAYTFRYKETPELIQEGDHVATGKNPSHPEGFDNVSLLHPELCGVGVRARLRCAFDGTGCPEIILVKKPERCEDGAVRYGECIEVVLYKGGVNVWRHFMDEEYKCSWHLRLGHAGHVSEGEVHELVLEVKEKYITFSVGDIRARLRVEDLFDRFYIGVTACEGIVRLYDFTVEMNE